MILRGPSRAGRGGNWKVLRCLVCLLASKPTRWRRMDQGLRSAGGLTGQVSLWLDANLMVTNIRAGRHL